jgi:hypothetical protein
MAQPDSTSSSDQLTSRLGPGDLISAGARFDHGWVTADQYDSLGLLNSCIPVASPIGVNANPELCTVRSNLYDFFYALEICYPL